MNPFSARVGADARGATAVFVCLMLSLVSLSILSYAVLRVGRASARTYLFERRATIYASFDELSQVLVNAQALGAISADCSAVLGTTSATVGNVHLCLPSKTLCHSASYGACLHPDLTVSSLEKENHGRVTVDLYEPLSVGRFWAKVFPEELSAKIKRPQTAANSLWVAQAMAAPPVVPPSFSGAPSVTSPVCPTPPAVAPPECVQCGNGYNCLEMRICPNNSCDPAVETQYYRQVIAFKQPESTVVDVAVGRIRVCALMANGNVKCFGVNGPHGLLGLENTAHHGDVAGTMGTNLPYVNFGSGRTVKAVEVECVTACVIMDNDRLKCWGEAFVLPNSPSNSIGANPGDITGLADVVFAGASSNKIVQVTSGDLFWGVVNSANEVFVWGMNGAPGSFLPYGGTVGGQIVKVQPPGGETPHRIAVGNHQFCILMNSGKVYCFGDNVTGSNGNGGTTIGALNGAGIYQGGLWPAVALPKVGGLPVKAKEIFAGSGHSCAILDAPLADRVACWGNNHDGQLGVDSTIGGGIRSGGVADPIALIPLATVKTMALSEINTCAQLQNNSVWCWGYGFSPAATPYTPVPLTFPGRQIAKIKASNNADEYCVIFTDGTLYCWQPDGGGATLFDGYDHIDWTRSYSHSGVNQPWPTLTMGFGIPATWYWPDLKPTVNIGP